MLARDKHSSLSQKPVNYDRKKFYSTGQGVKSFIVDVFNFFGCVSIALGIIKRKCLTKEH
jgi:hypothetical protein